MAGGTLWDRTVEEQALCFMAVKTGMTPQPETSPHILHSRRHSTYMPLVPRLIGLPISETQPILTPSSPCPPITPTPTQALVKGRKGHRSLRGAALIEGGG